MILSCFCRWKCIYGKRAFQIHRGTIGTMPVEFGTDRIGMRGSTWNPLAGDASYFGKVVKKPYIGDAVRKVEFEDIKRINQLMYLTAWLCELLCIGMMGIAFLLWIS